MSKKKKKALEICYVDVLLDYPYDYSAKHPKIYRGGSRTIYQLIESLIPKRVGYLEPTVLRHFEYSRSRYSPDFVAFRVYFKTLYEGTSFMQSMKKTIEKFTNVVIYKTKKPAELPQIDLVGPTLDPSFKWPHSPKKGLGAFVPILEPEYGIGDDDGLEEDDLD